MQFQSKKKGKTAAAFVELVDALATLAFMPGGVVFCGRTWQATHPGARPKGLAKA